MTRTEIETALRELNELVLNGSLMEAFERYYHDDVVMQENELAPTVSKNLNREREARFMENVLQFRSASVLGLAVGDNISYVTWHYDYTHREWGIRNYTQVSIQHWHEGRIIREQFVYAN